MVYQRNGKVGENTAVKLQQKKSKPVMAVELNTAENEPGGIRINGYEQVLDLLKTADYDFRVNLLKRLHEKNPKLGVMLFQELVLSGHIRT